ncbi:hypothetical protein EKO23_15170 [Nocardioides guangzhouensis]|uniref:Uncharacterized protein n=1 Tax=Nocardioides guangzhouensis TaxID=2497878 RepID=A0A4Q4Z9Q4_9ACTN|nr:hypothetical protein [Nocardioides guangzhouensis]RYP84603.1 hypothetical protein EKO23_15170 [Nocardioides guangzhouensis]
MTAWHPNPYQPPSPPPPKKKPRPSGWWFVLGGGLMVAALAVAVLLFALLFKGLFTTDASLRADGQAHEVTVPTDGDRMLWADTLDGEPDCRVTDTETGDEIPLSSPSGEFQRNEQTGFARLHPGSGRLSVTCAGSGEQVEIGPAPSLGGLVGGVLAAILVPMLLGSAGFVVVLVTGILWATRPARPKA